MDQFLKKMSLIKILYRLYFLLFFIFIISFIFIIPKALHLSKMINSWLPPKLAYGSIPFEEKKIENVGKITSVYRGHFKRNGVYKNKIPLHLKVLWKSFSINGAIHGASKASPAVDDSGVYVGGDDGWFYAFHHDGSLKWKYYTFYSHRGIHSTAMLSKKYVWFGSYNGRLYCLNKSTGEVMWSLKLADAIGSSPLFYKGFIYLSVETTFLNGYVLKIQADTGEVAWRSPWLGEQIHSSVALNLKNRLLYVGANNNALYALNMGNGRIVWSYNAGGPIKGTPLFDMDKGRVYFSSWAKRLTALDGKTGQVVLESYIHSASQSSPTEIPLKDVLVISTHRRNNFIYGIRKSSGQILWKKALADSRIGLHSGFSAKSTTGKWLYYGVCSKNTFCVLDPLTGKTLSEVNIQGVLTGAPVPYKSSIYLSLDHGGLIKLGRQ